MWQKKRKQWKQWKWWKWRKCNSVQWYMNKHRFSSTTYEMIADFIHKIWLHSDELS